MLTMFISCVAVGVTRLHDRNRGAWWTLLFYLAPPVMQTIASSYDLDAAVTVALMVLSGALSVWALIELGCLAGTPGRNRYGPNPLAPETADAAPAR